MLRDANQRALHAANSMYGSSDGRGWFHKLLAAFFWCSVALFGAVIWWATSWAF